ncbi:MAG: hypothetical protein AAGU32_21780, partial [Bacillota bacterium]
MHTLMFKSYGFVQYTIFISKRALAVASAGALFGEKQRKRELKISQQLSFLTFWAVPAPLCVVCLLIGGSRYMGGQFPRNFIQAVWLRVDNP